MRGKGSVDSTALARTFTWLESDLAQARQVHKKAWLMLHIPPGIDGYSTMMQYRCMAAASSSTEDLCSTAIVPMWKPLWGARFDSLLREYKSTVTATFSGHDHTDDFRVIDSGEAGGEFVLIDPPVSPIHGQNLGILNRPLSTVCSS